MMNTRTLKGAASICAMVAAGLAAPASAQDAEDPSFLGQIILVGTGLPTEVLDSPASVSVLGETEISRVPPSSVARVLEQIPGIRVTQSGIERIQIRGESSGRVAIQIDGQPLTDHTGYGTPILVSPDSIERIEVVRGPSSVISGNNAIGGVVNIITKRGADAPIEVTTSAGYLGATDGYRGSVSVAGNSGNLDYRLSYSKSELGDIKTPSGTIANSDVEDQDLSLYLGYTLNNHYFGLRAQHFDLSANVGTGDPNFKISLPHRDLRKYSAFYEGTNLTPWMSLLKLDAYTQTIDREFVNDITIPLGPMGNMNVLSGSVDEQKTWGLSAKAELDFAPGHRTTVGLSYENDRQIADKRTVTTTPFAPFPATTLRYSDATIRTFSAYVQHEMTLSDRLTATLGGRYYKVDSDRDIYRLNGVDQAPTQNSDSRVVGAAGLVYKPNEDTTLRASISQGYTYPTISQLYLETTAGGRGVTRGNPDLKPEASTSYELGARVDRDNWVLDATVFYSDAKDYIASVPDGPRDFTYVNVNAARSWGAELTAEFDSGVWGLRPYANVAWLQREFTYSNGYATKDSGSPEFGGRLGVRRDWTAGSVSGEWDLYLAGESAATLRSARGAVAVESEAYATLNLQINADLTDNVSVNFGAYNILDKQYQPIGQYEASGRNISLFLTAKF